ncbi:putative proteinase inhibitor I4 serpin [Monocercomonoides exilis]|uniref:putative proteinase inhibitor I4 serpin n=1 Tax=Monocercomonoides exilis TaxID=2049356 RepID=UPI00355AA488|nr:putative proteinase inhibitor I4 serpin [Monocercomonoides exilis]|eukprot:MONOS_4029.1-p1 / transcript=MONOS_4029.1 / gene=MONOS_4029 / organism=Monocercomonoides_exilis_PA203 / gene_product=Serpin / transcript_product=Serpin / location=Mono_scaffold00102:37087-38496(+) / protein_length=400 / sequence_SO=supercontig / SO=protein_coding / is_pseudo=false
MSKIIAEGRPGPVYTEPSEVSKEEYGAMKAAQGEYINNFCTFLLEQLLSDKAQNIFISPLSVHTALMMAGSGATQSSLEAMRNVLQLNGFPAEKTVAMIAGVLEKYEKECPPPYQIANSLWINSKITVYKGFLDECGKAFGATAEILPFDSAAPPRINAWVNDKTKGLIKEIVSKLESDDEMVLLNTVYFKGEFQNQFKKHQTHDADFNLINGEKKQCKMMEMTERLMYHNAGDASFVSLGFKDRRMRMLVMLPAEKGEEALRSCAMKYLRAGQFKDVVRGLSSTLVALSLPRFNAEFSASLVQALTKMGLGICFTDDAKFERMSPEALKISDVIHKTVLKVDENGVEAAAATAVMMMRCMGMIRPVSFPVPFVVDRPFVVSLYDEYFTSIFSGIIYNV